MSKSLKQYNEYLSQHIDIDPEHLDKLYISFLKFQKKIKKSKEQRQEEYLLYIKEKKDKLIEDWINKFPNMKKEEIEKCWEKDIDISISKDEKGKDFLQSIKGCKNQTLKKVIYLYEKDFESFSRLLKSTLENHATRFYSITEIKK